MLAYQNEMAVQTITLNAEVIKDLKKVVKGHKKASHEIFNHVLFELEEETGKLIATYSNSDLLIQKKYFIVDDTIRNTYKFSLPVDQLKGLKYIKNGETFIFEIDDNAVKIIRDKTKMTSKYFEAEEHYSAHNIIQTKDFFEVGSKLEGNYLNNDDLKKLFKATKSVSKAETRPVLNEIAIVNGNIYSTDSHKLYKALSNFEERENKITIPSSIIEKANDLLGKNEMFKIYTSEHIVKIESDNLIIADKICGGNYPEIERLIPSHSKLDIRVEQIHELYTTLKSMKKNTATIEIDINAEMLKLSMSQVDDNENETNIIETEIPVIVDRNDMDNNFKINIDPSFVATAIEQLDKEYLTFNFIGKFNPFKITKTNNENEMTLHSPVRVQ